MAYPSNEDDTMEAADTQIDATINKLADQYAGCDARSAEINDERKTIRENVEKLGINPKAFVHAVARIKQMSKTESQHYDESIDRVMSVIGDRQMELYPEHAERIRKREERKEAKAAEQGRSQEELDAATNENPRSDPAAGGAKPQTELQAEAEQSEGDAVLDAMAPNISQSDKAKRLREKAGLA